MILEAAAARSTRVFWAVFSIQSQETKVLASVACSPVADFQEKGLNLIISMFSSTD